MIHWEINNYMQTKDAHLIFEAYFVKKQVVKENTNLSTDPETIAKQEDPGHDGAQVTDKDMKAARYIGNKRATIAKSIEDTKKQQAQEDEERENGHHSDALYIWDYLLHQKKHSPQHAIKIINLAKAAFEHQI
jgi:hypothetical protein